jgi:hypothetical protein
MSLRWVSRGQGIQPGQVCLTLKLPRLCVGFVPRTNLTAKENYFLGMIMKVKTLTLLYHFLLLWTGLLNPQSHYQQLRVLPQCLLLLARNLNLNKQWNNEQCLLLSKDEQELGTMLSNSITYIRKELLSRINRIYYWRSFCTTHEHYHSVQLK